MKILIITGQTATGKTKLAAEYARKYNGELINCDSRQIYKHLDIVTGKDKTDKVKIWLYDIVDPKKYFSSYDYVQHAAAIINDIIKRAKTPIIVGGTYLYLKHLLYGIETENIPPDWKLRKRLNNKSLTQLQQILKKLNVQSFNQLNNSEKNNPQRLIRKIEISLANHSFRLTSFEPLRFELGDKIGINLIKIEYFGLKFKNKQKLREAIKVRVSERLRKGAIEEVKQLLKQGYSEEDPGLKTIGYQQIIAYLKGKLTKREAINQWITHEIQYAKRQYTFMKKDPNIVWKTI